MTGHKQTFPQNRRWRPNLPSLSIIIITLLRKHTLFMSAFYHSLYTQLVIHKLATCSNSSKKKKKKKTVFISAIYILYKEQLSFLTFPFSAYPGSLNSSEHPHLIHTAAVALHLIFQPPAPHQTPTTEMAISLTTAGNRGFPHPLSIFFFIHLTIFMTVCLFALDKRARRR